jgi:hypothetical protein
MLHEDVFQEFLVVVAPIVADLDHRQKPKNLEKKVAMEDHDQNQSKLPNDTHI